MNKYKNHNSKKLNLNKTKDITKKQENNLTSDTILSSSNKNKEVLNAFVGYESMINLSRGTIDKEFRKSSINDIYKKLISNLYEAYIINNKETNIEPFNEKYSDMIKPQTENNVYVAKYMSDIIVERTNLSNKVSEFSDNRSTDMIQKYVQSGNNIDQNVLSNNSLYPLSKE